MGHHKLLIGFLLTPLQFSLQHISVLLEDFELLLSPQLLLSELILKISLFDLEFFETLILIRDNLAELRCVIKAMVLLKLTAVHFLVAVVALHCDVKTVLPEMVHGFLDS